MINLEEFLNQELNEQKLERTYDRKYLNSKFKLYKKANASSINIEIWTSNHFDQRFQERFVDGNTYISTQSTIAGQTKFKDLKNWKSRTRKELDTVLINGLNEVITKYKLALGGYFIISKSTRMVIPIVIARIEDEQDKAAIISTILHTSMSNIDNFHIGREEYDSEDIYVERSLENFYNVLFEYYKNNLGILDDVVDDELGIGLQFIVEGQYNIDTNYPIIEVE